MNILAFDTSFGACSAALAWWDRVEIDPDGVPAPQGSPEGVARKVWWQGSATRFEHMERGHAERLVPMIEEVIAESPLGFEDIERIVVTNGPGTFTGVRIAVATARALALSTGATIATASSLHLMSREACAKLFHEACVAVRGTEFGEVPQGAHENFATKDVAIAVDARRDELYFQLFGGKGHDPITEPLLLSAADAAARLRDRETFVAGSGAERVCNTARALGRSLEPRFPDLEPNASYLIGLGAEEITAPLRPLYLRPPDAKPGLGPSIARLA